MQKRIVPHLCLQYSLEMMSYILKAIRGFAATSKPFAQIMCVALLASCSAGLPVPIEYHHKKETTYPQPKQLVRDNDANYAEYSPFLQRNRDEVLSQKALENDGTLKYSPLEATSPLVVQKSAPQTAKAVLAPAATAVAPGDVVRIGVLVPQTGGYGEMGKHLLDAATLALFHVDKAELHLMPYDTKGTPEGARAAMQSAVTDNVDVVVGPLLKTSVEAILPMVSQHNITTIAFSNSMELAGKGVYLLGFRPEQQIKRVVDYAKQQNISIFYALAPRGEYGDAVINTAARALAPVASLGGVIGIENSAVLENVYRYQGEGETLSEGITSLMSIADAATGSTPNSVGLLVPEGGRVLHTIANRLARRGVDSSRYRLLGSGAWDDPITLTHKRLQGGWFASSPPEPRQFFENSYKEMYGVKPPRLASLSYDSIALVASMAIEGKGFARKAIENNRGFYGVNGAFRFPSDAIAERALAILEVTANGFEEVDPAPETFPRF